MDGRVVGVIYCTGCGDSRQAPAYRYLTKVSWCPRCAPKQFGGARN